MQPYVLDYLRTHTFQELEAEHGVCARPSMALDKFSLNYDQLLSKSGDVVAEQCRGMVIRPRLYTELLAKDAQGLFNTEDVLNKAALWRTTVFVDGFDLLAWPMNRFYNSGDFHAASVDWSDPTLRVYEKLDGTCAIVYWDPLQRRWHAATRSVPEADVPIFKGHLEIGDTTYSQLFQRALVETRQHTSGKSIDWDVDGFDKVVHLNKELTYVFELVSPWNQVVVAYADPRVYLLAVRHTASGQEIPIEWLHMQHVLHPTTWQVNDIFTLTALVDTANPTQLEGAVVCDSTFRRVKVKNKSWVLASRCKDTVTASPRSALEAIIMGKIDDVVPIVSKDVGQHLLRMQEAYVSYCRSIDERFALLVINSKGSRKEFAAGVIASGDWSAPYFNLWEGRVNSAREWIHTICERGKLSTSGLDTILARMAVVNPI